MLHRNPGLGSFVAKSASAQDEVGDDRVGLQKWGNNVLAKTKHEPVTVQFGAFLNEEMPI